MTTKLNRTEKRIAASAVFWTAILTAAWFGVDWVAYALLTLGTASMLLPAKPTVWNVVLAVLAAPFVLVAAAGLWSAAIGG